MGAGWRDGVIITMKRGFTEQEIQNIQVELMENGTGNPALPLLFYKKCCFLLTWLFCIFSGL